MGWLSAVFLLLASAVLPMTSAFYMPGVKPLTFQEGDEVPLIGDQQDQSTGAGDPESGPLRKLDRGERGLRGE